ncbi:MAG: ABC transporter permease [Methylacidiphilales bacterium]|nr:ABC transporter permease [Candidatus Methylacidiphilales bacterium]
MEELIISAEHEEKNYWRDLWNYRELLYFLAWRDILVRYKQTTVGVAWAVIRPLINIVIITVIFQKVAKLPSNGIPPFLFVGAGTLLWQLFANAFSDSGGSLVGASNLISKIYFPRLLIPAAPLAVGFVDFTISLAILGAMMLWYQFIPDFRILAAPLFILLALTASLGAGLWIAALTVKYRDFRFITPFIVQTGFFLSPLGYSSDRFPGYWRWLYSINPMVGAIDGFRWAIFRGATALYWPGQIISILTSVILLTTAISYFRKTEKSFADII